jgi:hypothetical protein
MPGCDIDRKLCIEAAYEKRLFIYAAAANYRKFEGEQELRRI